MNITINDKCYKQLSKQEIILLNDEEIKYRDKQLDNFLNDLNDINECMDLINNLVDEQQININKIDTNLNKVDVDINKAIVNLQVTEKLAKKTFGLATIITLTTTGVIIGGPIGATIGLNSAIGLIGGITVGSIIGGTMGLSSGTVLRKTFQLFNK
jgi:hypothetical protein